MRSYFRSSSGLGLPPRNVKHLFNSLEEAAEQLEEATTFIELRRAELEKAGSKISDLIIYYVGHGGFGGRSSDFFLAIQATREFDPLASSVTAQSLAGVIQHAARGLRTYLILDCCFAGAFQKVFQSSGGPLGLAQVKLDDVLPEDTDIRARHSQAIPESGIGILCASGSRDPAKAPPGMEYTMFTDALLHVLRVGDADAPPALSLNEIQLLLRRNLTRRFADEAVRPEVHVPEQRRGRLDLLPLFTNMARAEEVRETAADAPSRPEPAKEAAPQVPTGITSAPRKRSFARLTLAGAAGVIGIALLAYRLVLPHGEPDAGHKETEIVSVKPPSTQTPEPAPAMADPLDLSPLYAGRLNVWFATSPNNSDKKQSVVDTFHQDFPHFQLDDRSVLQPSFVADWTAESGVAMPDVAFIDNYNQLRPLFEQNMVWQNWGLDRFQLNGWWVISKRSVHLEAGRAFLRWLAASPRWRPQPVSNDSLPVPDIKAIESKALAAVMALRSGDRGALHALLDAEAARADDDRSLPGLAITSAKPIETFGNSHLAFTIVDVAGSSDREYGLRHMSFIFRKHGEAWLILQLSRDAILENAERLFHDFDTRITGDGAQAPPPIPTLTEPADNADLPLPVSRRPELSWTVDSSAQVSFLVEMQMNVENTQAPPPINPRDLTDSYVTFVSVPSGQQSYRIDAPFAVNAQPYRVRIWAMNSAGMTSLSQWHSMYFIYTQPAGWVMLPIEHHVDRFGGDYRDFAAPSSEICRQNCASDARCRAFAFGNDVRHCWLKDQVNPANASPTLDSGVKVKN